MWPSFLPKVAPCSPYVASHYSQSPQVVYGFAGFVTGKSNKIKVLNLLFQPTVPPQHLCMVVVVVSTTCRRRSRLPSHIIPTLAGNVSRSCDRRGYVDALGKGNNASVHGMYDVRMDSCFFCTSGVIPVQYCMRCDKPPSNKLQGME